MSEVHDDMGASRLVSTARVEAHAGYRTAVGEAPLHSRLVYHISKVTGQTHLGYGCLTNCNELVADYERASVKTAQAL